MDAAFTRHRWTPDDVLRMLEAGLLHEDDPVELLDGDLCRMSPQGSRHRMTVVRVRQRLEAAFGAEYYVQDHSPVFAGPHSQPEPDVAVVKGPERFDAQPTAAEVALVVALSVTSQRQDRAKAAIYAGGGFPEYWHLDLEARRLTVYRQPLPADREYAVITLYREQDAVPVAGTTIPVTELLPPPA